MARKAVRKPTRCPSCGHEPFGSIMYGLPHMSEELRRDIESGRTVIGGCIVDVENPGWACGTCGLRMWSNGRIVEGRDR